MSDVYECPADDCEKRAELTSLVPHITSSTDNAHQAAADEKAWQNLDPIEGESNESETHANETGESGGGESDADDSLPEEDDPESNESEAESNETKEKDEPEMEDLERQRAQLKNGGNGGEADSKDGEETGEAATETEDPPSVAPANILPSFDTRTLIMVSAVAVVLIVGYLYLRSDDDESKDSEEPAGSSVDGIGDPDDSDESKDGVDDESVDVDDLEGGLTSH